MTVTRTAAQPARRRRRPGQARARVTVSERRVRLRPLELRRRGVEQRRLQQRLGVAGQLSQLAQGTAPPPTARRGGERAPALRPRGATQCPDRPHAARGPRGRPRHGRPQRVQRPVAAYRQLLRSRGLAPPPRRPASSSAWLTSRSARRRTARRGHRPRSASHARSRSPRSSQASARNADE